VGAPELDPILVIVGSAFTLNVIEIYVNRSCRNRDQFFIGKFGDFDFVQSALRVLVRSPVRRRDRPRRLLRTLRGC
jgi:hypothetical protein